MYTTLKEQRKIYPLKSHDGKLIKMKVSVDYQSPECIKMAGYIYLFSDVSNFLVIKFHFSRYSRYSLVRHL